MWEGYYLLKVWSHRDGYTETLSSQFWKVQHYLWYINDAANMNKHEERHKAFKKDLQLVEVTPVRNLALSMCLRNFAVFLISKSLSECYMVLCLFARSLFPQKIAVRRQQ